LAAICFFTFFNSIRRLFEQGILISIYAPCQNSKCILYLFWRAHWQKVVWPVLAIILNGLFFSLPYIEIIVNDSAIQLISVSILDSPNSESWAFSLCPSEVHLKTMSPTEYAQQKRHSFSFSYLLFL
jgi:hypothetical protein